MKANTKAGFSSLVLTAIGIIFLFSTNPQKLSPILLIVPFILFFLSLLLGIVFITTLMVKTNREVIGRRSFLFAVVIAAYPILLVLLQSIGQLAVRDVVTITLLLVLSLFYIARSTVSV